MAIGTETATVYDLISQYMGVSMDAAIWIVSIAMLWALIWKGFALWKSARKKSVLWFIILLIFNTVGILEILYIFVFSKISLKNKAKPAAKKKVEKKK